ncbi:hypothetical protein Hdeb2414_s0007g00243121 [Helianthus debilis subsp. tardiflorus]
MAIQSVFKYYTQKLSANGSQNLGLTSDTRKGIIIRRNFKFYRNCFDYRFRRGYYLNLRF